MGLARPPKDGAGPPPFLLLVLQAKSVPFVLVARWAKSVPFMAVAREARSVPCKEPNQHRGSHRMPARREQRALSASERHGCGVCDATDAVLRG